MLLKSPEIILVIHLGLDDDWTMNYFYLRALLLGVLGLILWPTLAVQLWIGPAPVPHLILFTNSENTQVTHLFFQHTVKNVFYGIDYAIKRGLRCKANSLIYCIKIKQYHMKSAVTLNVSWVLHSRQRSSYHDDIRYNSSKVQGARCYILGGAFEPFCQTCVKLYDCMWISYSV